MPKPKIEIIKMPMLDTGIGREAGFKDDGDLIAHAKAEREAMDPVAREIADRIDREFERVLFGPDAD